MGYPDSLRAVALAATAAAMTLAPGPGRAQELKPSTVPYCWEVYSVCVEAAYGFQSWRTGCYSDLTACLADKPVPACSAVSRETCTSYLASCREHAGTNQLLREDCLADEDACLMAFGC